VPMRISVFKLNEVELSIVRQCSGECVVVPYSRFEDVAETEEPQIYVINAGFSGFKHHYLKEQFAHNTSFQKNQIILIVDDPDLEDFFPSDLYPNIDYYRKPLKISSLRARISYNVRIIEAMDCAREKEAQAALFESMFSQSPIGILLTHDGTAVASGTLEHFTMNPMVEKILGRSKDELKRLSIADVTHPDDLQSDLDNLHRLNAGEIDGYAMDKRYIRPDGTAIWVHIVVAPISIPSEERPLQICYIFDVSERKKLEIALMESERSKSVLLSHLPGMAYRCEVDPQWTMRFVSAGCIGLTGYSPEDLINNNKLSYNQIIAPEYRTKLWKEWERILPKKRLFKDEYEIITADGSRKWVMEAAQGIYDTDGKVEALEGIILDITDRKKIEQELVYYNEHDQWTGLNNRRAFESLLRLESRSRSKTKRAIIGINLSTLHSLSTTYGFDYAQKVVHKISEEFKRLSDDNHELFNTYVNRFVFFVRTYEDKQELVSFCKEVSRRLKSILTIERIGWGIGIIELGSIHARGINKLLRNLLVASEKSLTGFEDDMDCFFFDEQMELEIEREKEIILELSEIAAGQGKGRLYLQFQPIVDIKTDAICGFEALARLQSKKLGMISPMEFIPIAEKTKLMIPLGWKILQQAFQFHKRLCRNGFDFISISINISPVQLLRKEFLPNLMSMMEKVGVTPHLVSFEITESIFSSNYQEVNKILGQLKDLGFQIALDDFGTGYSSFARERELNINCLKIDKYFIDKLMYLEEHEAITGDIISMVHRLGHCVVAEGVEHEKQRDYLKKHGCDKIQGYLISKPVDEETAIELLSGYKAMKCDCQME